MKLSLVLPAFNEADNLPTVLNNITTFISNLGWDYEVIVVNDGSKDTTREVMLSWLKDRHIKLINHEQNRGYGATLRSGFFASEKEWVFFMDSDDQFDIKEITKLISYANNADLVIGFRAKRQDNWLRLLNAKIYNLAIKILFGLRVKDIDCAFKLMKKSFLDRINLQSDGAFINSELLIKAKQGGYKIKEVPVSHYPRTFGSPTGANLKVIIRAMREMIRFKMSGRV